jgi:hypothetical protein
MYSTARPSGDQKGRVQQPGALSRRNRARAAGVAPGAGGGGVPAEEVADGNVPAGDTPPGDAPAGDAPAGDAPAGDAPAEEVPSGVRTGALADGDGTIRVMAGSPTGDTLSTTGRPSRPAGPAGP